MKNTPPKWRHKEKINFQKPSRKVDSIWLHCSASDKPNHDDVSVMRNWHVNGNGWSDVGYHYFIQKNGNIQEGRPISRIPSAQKGYNTGAIAIACHGLKKENFTQAQMDSVIALCKAITDSYTEKLRIRGHREVAAKACPVYDYRKVLGLDQNGYYITGSNTPAPNPSPAKPPEPSSNTKPNSVKINSISLFDSSELVKGLEALLNKFGYQCKVDGFFGLSTLWCVIAFQTFKGLLTDGIVGKKTVNKMFSSANVVLRRGSKGNDVRALQILLAMHGQTILHDGDFGRGTKAALIKVQKKFSLYPDGVFGSKSRAAMLKA